VTRHMNRRMLTGALIVITLISITMMAQAATITVCSSGCDYTHIQSAINAAIPGDTIKVHSGTYYENVNINKQLTLRGVNTGGGKPVVDAGGSGSVITLSVDGITLVGFNATNSSKSDGSERFVGIKVNSNNNAIAYNTVCSNQFGIFLDHAINNTITSNNACNNILGITLIYSSKSNILRNNVCNNTHGGILIGVSSINNIINGNNVNNNSADFPFGNIIFGDGADNNLIFQNNFVNYLANNVGDNADNQWDNDTIGNHFNNFDEPVEGCTDIDGDGICDSGYNIPGGSNVDRYPLVSWSDTEQPHNIGYGYPTAAFPGQETELTMIVDLTKISMNVGDPVQWYITTPVGNIITGESDTLKCCLAGGLYDRAYYDFPEYGTYTIRVEFPGYTEYAEWNIEVWGPTGKITGEITDPASSAISNIDIYLYDAKDKHKVLDFIDEWRTDPTALIPPSISSTKSNNTGSYNFTEIIPGSYLVLTVPLSDQQYLPKVSDVYPIEKDETEIIDIQLELKVRSLNELDDEMETVRGLLKKTVNNNTRAAADVYVDGYNIFHNLEKDWTDLLSIVLSAFNFVLDTTNPTATLGHVKLACNGWITNQIAVPIAEYGIDLSIADHWWNIKDTIYQDKMIRYSNQINSTTWMKEFYPNTISSPEDALQNGYYTTPMYTNSLSLIDNSFEEYNKTIAYNNVPFDFSLSQTENVLRDQVFWLHDKSDEETKIADGIIITPTGNVYLFKLAQAYKNNFNNAKYEMEVAKTGQTISEVTYTCGNCIAYKGALTLNPHITATGFTVKVIGWAGGIVFNSYELYAKNKAAKHWAYTQIYWVQDLDTIPKINQDIIDWLDNETKNPRLPYIDGRIIDTDLHLTQIPFTNKNIAFANKPDFPWWWVFQKFRWWIVNTNTISVENTGEIDNIKTRILCIDRYGNEFVSEMPTIYPNETEPPILIDQNETITIDLPYTGDFQPFNPFHWHYLCTILWMEGKQPDMETDAYYVIPLTFSPFPYTISSKTTLSTEQINTYMKQPIGSEEYTYTTMESIPDSPITLEDWGNLLGNCTKIIDDSLDPVNDSTQVRYTTNASITDITFIMTSIPGSHLNLHIYDELGRHIGYFPINDSDQIQIPNATYNGNNSNPEIILIPNAASKNFTIKVDATQFTSSSPIPVEVYAIETPIRPAVFGISPVELYPFTSIGDEKNITLQLAEVGQQVGIEGITIQAHDFVDKFGNPIPDITTTFSQNNFDIGAGNMTPVTISINVSKEITLPDIPETRYTGNITIESLNAGTINCTIHLLVLDTDLNNTKLTFAEQYVTGVHVSSINLSDINTTSRPLGVSPQSAYMINSSGTGNFSLQFTDIADANTTEAYMINATDHWIPLNASVISGNITFTLSAENTCIVFASTEQIIRLYGGWNLISVPVNLTSWKLGNESILSDPLNVTPKNSLTSIYRYNTTSIKFEKSDHFEDWGWSPSTGSGNFTELEPGRGYWVMADQDCVLTFDGTSPSDLNITLNEDWNLVGWYSMSEALLGDEGVVGNPLNVTPVNILTSIYRYNTTTGLFEKCDHFPDWGWWPVTGSEKFTRLEPGRGYWVMAINDCEWQYRL